MFNLLLIIGNVKSLHLPSPTNALKSKGKIFTWFFGYLYIALHRNYMKTKLRVQNLAN